jgi:hypothetical protein
MCPIHEPSVWFGGVPYKELVSLLVHTQISYIFHHYQTWKNAFTGKMCMIARHNWGNLARAGDTLLYVSNVQLVKLCVFQLKHGTTFFRQPCFVQAGSHSIPAETSVARFPILIWTLSACMLSLCSSYNPLVPDSHKEDHFTRPRHRPWLEVC